MNLTISKLHPLTDTLLENFELTDQGQVILVDYYGSKFIGEYEWRQGRNPHGFEAGSEWFSASEFEYVAFFIEE